MNCKVCGTRLGILERWRYGDFCSLQHKTDFARDLEDLDRKLVGEPFGPVERPAAAPHSRTGAAQTADPAENPLEMAEEVAADEAGIPEPESDPPMAGFVAQPEPLPLKRSKQPKQEKKVPADKGEKAGQMWRAMAKLAEQEELPPSPRTAPPASRAPAIPVEAHEQTLQGPGGYFYQGAYSSLSPPLPGMIPANRLPYGNLSPHPAGFWGPAFALSMPLAPAQPRHWVDDQGWHWIADASATSVPTIENILSAYPMAAPWAQWPVIPPVPTAHAPSPGVQGGPGAGPRSFSPSSPGGQPASGQPGFGVSASGMPGAGRSTSGMTGAGGPSAGYAPATPDFSAPSPGFSLLSSINPGHALGVPSALPGSGLAGVMQGGTDPEQAPSPGGPGVAGGLFGGGQMVGWGLPQYGSPFPVRPGGSGYVWRELPPPFFSALVDLSSGVKALAIPSSMRTPDSESLPVPACGPASPRAAAELAASLRPAPVSGIATAMLARRLPPTAEYNAGPGWRIPAAKPPRSPGLPNPRVPRRAAPPLILPLGARLGLPRPAEPLMAAGSGVHGGRGV